MKKKKVLSIIAAISVAASLTACQLNAGDDLQLGENRASDCNCTNCPCCENNGYSAVGNEESAADITSEQSETIQPETVQAETEQPEPAAETEENQTADETDADNETDGEDDGAEGGEDTETSGEYMNEIQKLTEGEKAARRQQQLNFNEAREGLYTLANSKSKTEKIVQMDRQILANNSYDFSDKNVVFIGDSITEGIEGAIDQNGNFVSYVTYANSHLHFRNVLNHGKGGRMFSTYGGDEFSLALNFDNVTNIDSDIIVVFAGINDYITSFPEKRFGNVENKESTAGFCGGVRQFMEQLKRYYSDRDIFFVTMYNVPGTVNCTFSDYDGQPDLGDYMEAERELAEEYGFNIIELYDTGFMDCTDKESSEYYLRDELHPKDNGNIALGAHIAAELSLYFSQNE